MNTRSLTRRRFLLTTGAVASGLIVGCSTSHAKSVGYAPVVGAFEPNSFIQITSDNQVIFYLPSSEMGQGILDGLSTLIAEELRVSPELIEVRHASLHEDYKNPEMKMQATGGSNATRAQFLPIRQAAADAAAAIRNAAAQQLNQPVDKLLLADGQVLADGQRYAYSEFVALAAALPVPENSPLRSPQQFDQIGRERPRLDALAKSTGTAIFGIDAEVENLYRAVVVRAPVVGAAVHCESFDASAALQQAGVVDVSADYASGVAVVAASLTGERARPLRALELNWGLRPSSARWSSDSLYQEFVPRALNDCSAERVGVLCWKARATSCSIKPRHSGCRRLITLRPIWRTPPWSPSTARLPMDGDSCARFMSALSRCKASAGAAVYYGDFDADKVKMHPAFLGGGFGRRRLGDDVAEAVELSRKQDRAQYSAGLESRR